jgi:hypothetical protein
MIIAHANTFLLCLFAFVSIQDFLNKLPSFVRHHYVKRTQSSYYRQMLSVIDEDRVLMQIDFAENYLCQSQDEIQAAHWLQSQVSVFTACVWCGGVGMVPYVIVSDNLQHNKMTVSVNLFLLLRILEVHGKHLTVFSDGPASQFRNKYILALLPKLREKFGLLTVQWSFFAAAHGKGPVDGIGGQAKRQVWQSVSSRKVISVSCAAEFCQVLQNGCSTIQVIHCTSDMEALAHSFLNVLSVFENAQQTKGISEDHFWLCSPNGSILRSCVSHGGSSMYEMVEIPESNPNITLSDNNPDPSTSVETPDLNPNDYIRPGVVVKCQYQGKKGRSVNYIGEILEVAEKIHIKFLRREGKGLYTFPEKDDCSWEPMSNVSMLCSQPTVDNRGRYLFHNCDPLV